MRKTLALALVLMVLGASSCAVRAESGSIAGQDALRIGVKFDQPGLGRQNEDGTFEGFDVDVARYVAGWLGVAEEDIEWVGVTSAEREDLITSGEVDLILATYSITPRRKTEVTFAGPYYVAHQDILVRADADHIEEVADLDGQSLCQGRGSNSANRVIEERGLDARLEEPETYGECIAMLSDGTVDAVTTDDLILAGFALEYPGSFKLLNTPFTDEKYGVGMAQEDLAGCEEVNRAITRMFQDGTAAELLEKWFGETELEPVPHVPQFEGCGSGAR